MAEVGGTLYLVLKVLHILGVVAFLGGLLMQLYWKLSADRSGDPAFAVRVHQRLRKMDSHWVGPGALVTFAAGYAMVRGFGSRIAQQPFAFWGLVFMFLSLALWYLGQRRVGDQLVDEARAAEGNRKPLGVAYGKKSAAWVLLNGGSVGLVVLVVVLMVFRWPRELWPF